MGIITAAAVTAGLGALASIIGGRELFCQPPDPAEQNNRAGICLGVGDYYDYDPGNLKKASLTFSNSNANGQEIPKEVVLWKEVMKNGLQESKIPKKLEKSFKLYKYYESLVRVYNAISERDIWGNPPKHLSRSSQVYLAKFKRFVEGNKEPIDILSLENDPDPDEILKSMETLSKLGDPPAHIKDFIQDHLASAIGNLEYLNNSLPKSEQISVPKEGEPLSRRDIDRLVNHLTRKDPEQLNFVIADPLGKIEESVNKGKYIKLGSTDSDSEDSMAVRATNYLLLTMGYLKPGTMNPSSEINKESWEAIKNLQRDLEVLPEDGIIGPRTLAALKPPRQRPVEGERLWEESEQT